MAMYPSGSFYEGKRTRTKPLKLCNYCNIIELVCEDKTLIMQKSFDGNFSVGFAYVLLNVPTLKCNRLTNE